MGIPFYDTLSVFYGRMCQAGIASIVLQTEPSTKPITISADAPGMKKITIQIEEGK
jgi:hypothetical protein